MKRISLLLTTILTFTLLLMTSCNENGLCQRGTGEVEIRTLTFDAISGIEISGETIVYLQQGETQSVQLETYPNVFDALNFRVVNGMLFTDLEGCWNNTDMVLYLTITEPLEAIDISGAGEVIGETLITTADRLTLDVSGSGDINLDIEAAEVASDLSGAGDITLSGTATNQSVEVSGSGRYRAFDLIADDCVVDISGAGRAEVYVNGSLNANVSGSGQVLYRGTPTSINTDISGSGRVQSDG